MSTVDESTSYCQYCKGILLTQKELELESHESCLNSIVDFHNSLVSNIEYYTLDSEEYLAILQLEKLNTNEFGEENVQNESIVSASVYNNKISAISLDFKSLDVKIEILPDFKNIFESFTALMNLTIKNTNFTITDRILNFKVPRLFFINLSNNNLYKIPLSLFKMTSLRILNLSHNNLVELPIHMNNFQLLNSLHLNNNKIERLPRFIGNYKRLKTLKLGSNKLTSFPYQLMFLKNLQDLDISYNSISTIPSNISYLKGLSTFNASNNYLRDISDSFSDLDHLRIINLSNNMLTRIPISLVQNEKIFSLNFANNKLKNIAKLPKTLTSLNLSNNELTHLPEKVFLNLEHLTTVDISYNNLKTIPKSLLENPNLRLLKITNNPISDPVDTVSATILN
jgi:Leucine-rich repeat (LRR) protein